jgi:small subunit ribosomal protein SAe
MAYSQLPTVLDATQNDIEMILFAQCHIGSKNVQPHMEAYHHATRADGINIINFGMTWYISIHYCYPLSEDY